MEGYRKQNREFHLLEMKKNIAALQAIVDELSEDFDSQAR